MSTIAELLIGIGIDPKGIEKAGSKLAPVAKAAGIAIGGAMMAGAVIGMEQEAIADKVAAQLRLTGPEAEMAGDIAGRLYADAYGQSFEHASEAVGAVIGTLGDQVDPSAIEEITRKALDWAAAFDGDVTEAVTNAGILMKTGLARDANHAFDLITAGSQEIAPGLRDELNEATAEYSKFFGALGFTGEETFGLLASADDKFALDKTGDAIKELSIRATDMSSASVEAFTAMGLDAKKMADNILAGGDTARGAFDTIIDGLLSIENPTDRANAAIALFGTPMEDLSTAQIPEVLRSLQNMGGGLDDVAGRADEMGDTLNDNAATKVTAYKRGIEQMLAKVVELPGVFGDVAAATAGFGQVVGPMAPALTGMAILFQGSFSKIVGVVGGAMSAIGKLLMANPWILLIAAVITLAVLIVKNWDKIKAATAAVRDWIVDKFTSVIDFFRSLGSRISAATSGMWDGIKNAFRAAINWIIDKWNNFKITVGGFALPKWLGGGTAPSFTFTTPAIPRLHEGGMFEAPPGHREGLALLEDGERVTPAKSAGPGPQIYIGTVYGYDDFVRKVREAGVAINRYGWQS